MLSFQKYISEWLELEEGKGYSPGWMLKKDPELAKKLKDKIDLAKKRQASYGNPAAGKSVKEEVELDEAVDPSEIAGNPKAYNVDAVKKAYYHKKVSASDKESLGRHLDRYHGHKEWRKPLVKEETDQLDELSSDTLKSYAKKAGAEATGVKGKHLSKEKSNKRFDGHAKAMQRLTKEDTEQIDELSKKTLGSYVNKSHAQLKAHASNMAFKSGRGDSDALSTMAKSADKEKRREKGLSQAVNKLTKESTDQLDELSKETLGSYKHKAELSIPKDDREYANRSKGIDKAEKKLKKEDVEQIDELSKKTIGSYVKKAAGDLDYAAWSAGLHGSKVGHNYYVRSDKRREGINKAADRLAKEDVEQIDEMTQGKSYTQDQLRKKMQSGNWEATHDIKPGKHVEMRHHTGKRVMVHVKEETSLGEAAIKVGDTVIYNKNKTAQTVGKVHKIEDNDYILHHTKTNTYHRVPKKGSELAESVEQLDELSPNLLHRYVKKAAGNMGLHAVDHGRYGDEQKDKKSLNKAVKRLSGITSASGRMADKANRTEEFDLDESEINDLAAQYINENNITLEELENMTEAELNELIGAAVGGAFKLGAKAAVGAGRLAGRAINRMTTSGRADAAEKKASALEKKNADRERIRAAQDRLRKAKEAASKR